MNFFAKKLCFDFSFLVFTIAYFVCFFKYKKLLFFKGEGATRKISIE